MARSFFSIPYNHYYSRPKYTINDRDQDIYFNELLDEIECPNTELTSGMTSILEVLMNFQRDITARRRFIDANEVSKVFDR